MTSTVDPINEVKIQRALSNLTVNRTVLIIPYHLRTIQAADTILVFNNGEIVESGTHAKHLEESLYRKLWQAQEEAKQWKPVNPALVN